MGIEHPLPGPWCNGVQLVSSPYFDPGSQRAAKVQQLFARIAPRYDLINDLQSAGLHRLWKRRVVEMAGPGPAVRALDLCCGTGDLAIGLARGGAWVVGLDFSAEMLRIAQRRAADCGLWREAFGVRPLAGAFAGGLGSKAPASEPTPDASRFPTSVPAPRTGSDDGAGSVRFVRADALRVPFPDQTFDIVTIGYGLRNLADLERGLVEIRRVLRPGGRLVALDFGKPESSLARKLYFAYLRAGVPWFGRIFCGDSAAYAYILDSLERFPGRQALAEALSALSFENITAKALCGGVMVLLRGEIGCQKPQDLATIDR
jgi:demethylmenaquinone methyltransferase/2-methoxy-6-polyprenyl-1,4-benzoquinol methylase